MTLRFAGYAALFGKPDAARDVIRQGAFARTLAERRDGSLGRLPLYWQHRPEQRIGWVEAVREDARGLRVIAAIDNPDGGAGRALRRGTVSGLSFGYRARTSRQTAAGRELLDVDLIEVSLVSHPMQHAARVHLLGTNQTAIPGLGWFSHAPALPNTPVPIIPSRPPQSRLF